MIIRVHDSMSKMILDAENPTQEQIIQVAQYISSLERRLTAAEKIIGAFDFYRHVKENGDYDGG